MHSLNIFGARTSHEQTQTHKIHHGPDLGEATTFPLIVYFVALHEAHIQMTFCLKTPKCESIILRSNLWLGWSSKQSCSPRWNLSNSMSHATWTWGNRGDSRLLVVRSQIANLTPILSFGHNLCFRCPNESCEPISDIYVPRVFQ